MPGISLPSWPDVAVAGQLVAAAHREHRGAARHAGVQRPRVALQILGHEHLVAILAAADEVEVGGSGSSDSPTRSGRSSSSSPRHSRRRRMTWTLPRSA